MLPARPLVPPLFPQQSPVFKRPVLLPLVRHQPPSCLLLAGAYLDLLDRPSARVMVVLVAGHDSHARDFFHDPGPRPIGIVYSAACLVIDDQLYRGGGRRKTCSARVGCRDRAGMDRGFLYGAVLAFA